MREKEFSNKFVEYLEKSGKYSSVFSIETEETITKTLKVKK